MSRRRRAVVWAAMMWSSWCGQWHIYTMSRRCDAMMDTLPRCPPLPLCTSVPLPVCLRANVHVCECVCVRARVCVCVCECPADTLADDTIRYRQKDIPL